MVGSFFNLLSYRPHGGYMGKLIETCNTENSVEGRLGDECRHDNQYIGYTTVY